MKQKTKDLILILAILIAGILIFVALWNREERKPDLASIQPMEYYSVDTKDVDTTYIMFYFDNVIDYIQDGDNYTIEYDDPDVFDYEYYMDKTYDSTYMDCITINVSKSDFYELFGDSELPIVERAYLENDWKWVILEVATTIVDDATSEVKYKWYLKKY